MKNVTEEPLKEENWKEGEAKKEGNKAMERGLQELKNDTM